MHWTINRLLFFTLGLVLAGGGIDSKKPRITKFSAQLGVSIGQTATLYCHFTGKPRPQINWTKLDQGGHPIQENCNKCIYKMSNARRGISTLNIFPFKDEDFGRYECRLRNKYGMALRRMTLAKVNLTGITHCKYDRILARDPRLRIGFLPSCDPDGKYHRVQCSVHTSDCWCVDRENGHKNAEAHPIQGGFHCTPAKDIRASAIVTIVVAVIFLFILGDVFLFVFYKQGAFAVCLRMLLKWRSTRRGGDPMDSDAPTERCSTKIIVAHETDSPIKEKRKRRKKKKKTQDVYHAVNLEDDDNDVEKPED